MIRKFRKFINIRANIRESRMSQTGHYRAIINYEDIMKVSRIC